MSIDTKRDVEYIFSRLEKTVPSTFRAWRNLLLTNKKTFEGFLIHSCSVSGHKAAGFFGDFIAQYLKGRVLDIGCGPQPIPLYLEGYSTYLIWGIVPLSKPEDHPFNFQNGVAEFLPWTKGFFDVVTPATLLGPAFLQSGITTTSA